MMTGKVVGASAATIPLVIVGPAGQSEEVEAVIDTGFTGELTLPPRVTTLLGLTFLSLDDAVLADGIAVKLPVYDATVLWDGATRQVTAMEANGDPLIGMTLLEGQRLTIDAVDGGPVTIEPIA